MNNDPGRGGNGFGRILTTTKIEPITRRIPKTHARTAVPKVCTARTPSRCLQKTKSTKAIQPKGRELATNEMELSMAATTKDPRNRS